MKLDKRILLFVTAILMVALFWSFSVAGRHVLIVHPDRGVDTLVMDEFARLRNAPALALQRIAPNPIGCRQPGTGVFRVFCWDSRLDWTGIALWWASHTLQARPNPV